MKWLMDCFLPRLLLGALIFCFMIVTGMIGPAHAEVLSLLAQEIQHQPVELGGLLDIH